MLAYCQAAHTSTKVMQHIEATWKRGAEVVAMVRAALGARADELVPLLHGGVHIFTLKKGSAAKRVSREATLLWNATERDIFDILECRNFL